MRYPISRGDDPHQCEFCDWFYDHEPVERVFCSDDCWLDAMDEWSRWLQEDEDLSDYSEYMLGGG